MKNRFKCIMLLAVMLLTTPASWAAGVVRIVTTGQGEMTYSMEGTTCTLTATPAAGYCITGEHIRAVMTIDGGTAHAPSRAPQIVGEIVLTAINAGAPSHQPTQYTFEMPASPYDVEVTADFQREPFDRYGIFVGSTQVTSANCTDILGDGTMSYDNDRRLLTLSGTRLKQAITLADGDLTVFLAGDNRIETTAAAAIEAQAATSALTIVTNQNEPGRLTASTGAASADPDAAFSGFATITKNNGLTAVLEKAGVTSVFVPITPVVTSVTEKATEQDAGTVIDMNEESNAVAQETLVNVTIDGILYTLDDQQEAGLKDDGFVENHEAENAETGETVTANIVVLNSTMTDEDVKTLADQAESGAQKPGTDSYAEAFKGVTFLLPKGEGMIYLKNVITDGSHALKVKIGKAEPVSYTTDGKYEDKELPYSVDEDTYVYIYVVEVSSAPLLASHRIGPKAGVSGGLGGLSISASKIDVPVSKPLDAAIVATATAAGTIVVKDLEVKTIANGAFSGVSKALAYIDLSATSITGVTVSRTAGPFSGVDANTFIYMPAGNTTTEPNVVIGSTCANMQLDGDGTHAFRTAKAFTATEATLNRTFTADKRGTVYLPFAVSQATADGLGRFYRFDGISGTTVNMTQVTEGGLKANTPYIFVPAGSVSKVSTTAAAVKTAGFATLNFVGTYEPITWLVDQSDVYCFAGDETGGFEVGMFARMAAGSSVAPFRAYMRTTALGASALDINWIDGESEATGISGNTCTLPATDGPVYNLQGQLVNGQSVSRQLPKGVYIVNGKKTVIK